MLNILYCTREQKGFILPFVLFALVLMMLLVTSGMHIYQNNLRLTDHHIQQLKFETLFQSGLALFKQNLLDEDVPLPKSPDETLTKEYTFPDGEVELEYMKAKEEELVNIEQPAYRLNYKITIDELMYSFTHYVTLPNLEGE